MSGKERISRALSPVTRTLSGKPHGSNGNGVQGGQARYSAFDLFRRGLTNDSWPPVWREHELSSSYDVIVIGGGVHGLAMGRALAPLRDEGVFIIGTGMTYHNMRGFGDPRARPVSEVFDAWLREAATSAPEERDRRLTDWAHAPSARLSHPREEHLLPLMVVAGAAGADRGTVPYNGTIMGLRLSAYHYG